MAADRKNDGPLGEWPKEPATFTIPRPISHRADLLIEEARRAGERIHRNELVAALILRAPEDGDVLGAMVRDYRKASAREAVTVGKRRVANVLELPRQRPGPRKDHRLELG